MKQYRLTAEAEQDLDEIKTYLLGQGGVRLVRHAFGRLQRAMNLLGAMPEIGHGRPDLTDAAVKFWSVFSYLIIYDPVPRPISVVRILHGNRDVGALLREQPNGKD